MHSRLSCIFAFLLIIYCTTSVEAGLSDAITELFEEFRVRMCHPFPQWKLPALDPYEIKHEEIYINNNILKNFSASVTDLKVTGLSDFIINEIKISTLTQKFMFDLTFPLEVLQSQYTAKGSLGYVVNLVGDGNMNGQLDDVRIIFSGRIKLGLTFGVKNLDIKFGIGKLFVDMGKLLEHDAINTFIHNLINELSIELLGDFWEDFSGPLTEKLENKINKKMSNFTLKEVIAIISGSGEPIFADDPPGDCKNQLEPNSV